MKKALKNYLHFYIGAEVQFKVIPGFQLSGKVRKLTPNLYAEIYNYAIWDKVQLMLRPVGDTTPEEAKKWNSLVKSDESKAEAVAYYIRRQLDVFGLIEAELAIEADPDKTPG